MFLFRFIAFIGAAYPLPFSMGMWMILAIISAGYLLLSGLVCIKLEKLRAERKAQRQAELDMYRQQEERRQRH